MTNLSLVIDDDDDGDNDKSEAKKRKDEEEEDTTQKCIRLNHHIKMRLHYNVSESEAYMRSLYDNSTSIYKRI